MTTPQDPQRGNRPGQGPYGGQPGHDDPPSGPNGSPQQDQYRPGALRPGQYPPPPGPYGSPAAPGPPPPYGAGQQPLSYNPYGTPYPAGLDESAPAPVPRPAVMIVGLVLMILSALPFLAAGLFLLLVPLSTDGLPPGLIDDPRLVQAGATPELLITAVRVFAGIILFFSLVYVVLAVLAFQGRNWARILTTVLTVGFALLLVASLVGGGAPDSTSLIFVLVVLAAIVGGVVILFLPDSSRFFAAARRR